MANIKIISLSQRAMFFLLYGDQKPDIADFIVFLNNRACFTYTDGLDCDLGLHVRT